MKLSVSCVIIVFFIQNAYGQINFLGALSNKVASSITNFGSSVKHSVSGAYKAVGKVLGTVVNPAVEQKQTILSSNHKLHQQKKQPIKNLITRPPSTAQSITSPATTISELNSTNSNTSDINRQTTKSKVTLDKKSFETLGQQITTEKSDVSTLTKSYEIQHSVTTLHSIIQARKKINQKMVTQKFVTVLPLKNTLVVSSMLPLEQTTNVDNNILTTDENIISYSENDVTWANEEDVNKDKMDDDYDILSPVEGIKLKNKENNIAATMEDSTEETVTKTTLQMEDNTEATITRRTAQILITDKPSSFSTMRTFGSKLSSEKAQVRIKLPIIGTVLSKLQNKTVKVVAYDKKQPLGLQKPLPIKYKTDKVLTTSLEDDTDKLPIEIDEIEEIIPLPEVVPSTTTTEPTKTTSTEVNWWSKLLPSQFEHTTTPSNDTTTTDQFVMSVDENESNFSAIIKQIMELNKIDKPNEHYSDSEIKEIYHKPLLRENNTNTSTVSPENEIAVNESLTIQDLNSTTSTAPSSINSKTDINRDQDILSEYLNDLFNRETDIRSTNITIIQDEDKNLTKITENSTSITGEFESSKEQDDEFLVHGISSQDFSATEPTSREEEKIKILYSSTSSSVKNILNDIKNEFPPSNSTKEEELSIEIDEKLFAEIQKFKADLLTASHETSQTENTTKSTLTTQKKKIFGTKKKSHRHLGKKNRIFVSFRKQREQDQFRSESNKLTIKNLAANPIGTIATSIHKVYEQFKS